jgi:hypothetical protein
MFEILDSAMATMRQHICKDRPCWDDQRAASLAISLQNPKRGAVIALPIGALKRVKIPLGAFIMATAVALLFLLTDFES